MLEAGEPEGRLPDARFALEHEGSPPSPCLADEGVEGAQLRLPADYLEHRLDRDRGRQQGNLDLHPHAGRCGASVARSPVPKGATQVSWSSRNQLLITHGLNAPLLELVRPDGSGLRTLRPGLRDEAFVNPKWSPDGRRITYEHWTGCNGSACGGGLGIEIADLRGNVIRSLGNGEYPTFSPSGTSIAYGTVEASSSDHSLTVRRDRSSTALSRPTASAGKRGKPRKAWMRADARDGRDALRRHAPPISLRGTLRFDPAPARSSGS